MVYCSYYFDIREKYSSAKSKILSEQILCVYDAVPYGTGFGGRCC